MINYFRKNYGDNHLSLNDLKAQNIELLKSNFFHGVKYLTSAILLKLNASYKQQKIKYNS